MRKTWHTSSLLYWKRRDEMERATAIAFMITLGVLLFVASQVGW